MNTLFVGRRRGSVGRIDIDRGYGTESLRELAEEWSGREVPALDWGNLTYPSALTAGAILLCSLDTEQEAHELCTAFLREVVARMPYRSWTLTATEVLAWAIDRKRRTRFTVDQAVEDLYAPADPPRESNGRSGS